MLAGAVRDGRPAAGDRRRSFVFAWSLLAAALAAACAPESTPAAELQAETARHAARQAIAAARVVEPRHARRVEQLLLQAERIARTERREAPWRRDPERVAAAWHRLGQGAWMAMAAVRERERTATAGWHEAEAAAAAELERASARLRSSAGLGRREAAARQRAAYNLDLARRLAATGAFEPATEAAERALAFVEVIDEGADALHRRFADPTLLKQWRRWAKETIAASKRDGDAVIIVDKLRRRLELYHRGKRVATYRAELGANGLKPKRHAGDQATPEGTYRVVERKEGGNTLYHKALLIDYPNREDVARFRRARLAGTIPRRAGIGGLIEIHGDGGEGKDWTDGCVALRNADMDAVYKRTRNGTRVTIVGTL